ncbi:protein glass-like [Anopheles coustani]|uniref:protein glass-like n=1 Tax=Anopheles coustani TaxID=139045 RepID=UPI00265B6CE9|nr:protein glass-like [Anopheles coustani]
MSSLSSDFVTSDNQLGAWGTYPYGYSEFTMPGSDWFTSLATDLEGSPLPYDPEMQHKEPYQAHQLAGGLHRISPLDSPVEVAEADSTQHYGYPFSMHQHLHQANHQGDFSYQNQKQAPPSKSSANAGARFVPHGYYNSSVRTMPSAAAPTPSQSSMYPSPPGQLLKHADVPSFNKPYGLLYVNGDHVPQPMAYNECPVPCGAQPPSDLYQPYAGVHTTPTYEGNLPSFQSVLPTGIDSVLPSVKYDWGSSSVSPLSPGTNPASLHTEPCFTVKEEYMATYHSPSPSSLAGGSSIKAELMSDTSQTPPPQLPAGVPPMQTPSPQLLPPLESVYVPETKLIKQQNKATSIVGPIASATLKKQARNNYGTLFSCPECDRTFARQCGLTQHMKWHHSGEKPFRCTTCGKCFSGEEALTRHFERHSAVDKPHRCHVCPKAFFHKNDLRRHVYQHTGAAPHNCKYCGKAFARKDHCHSHEYSHERKVERQEKKSKARERSEMDKLISNGLSVASSPSSQLGSPMNQLSSPSDLHEP